MFDRDIWRIYSTIHICLTVSQTPVNACKLCHITQTFDMWALLLRCVSNCKAIQRLQMKILQLQDIVWSIDMASWHIYFRGDGVSLIASEFCMLIIIWVSANWQNRGDLGKGSSALIHWGRLTHICIGTKNNIGSDNGLSPGRRQVIIWTNAGILLIGPLGTNFSGILSEIHTFSFKTMQFKTSSAK